MNRRSVFMTAVAAIAGVFAVRSSASGTTQSVPGVPKVVYHLADAEKVVFVLGNIRNHIDGMGGPDKVQIALVVHGAALKAFQAMTTNMDVRWRVGSLTEAGIEMHACANTMAAQKLTLKDLMPGFVSAEKGGVVRIVELQQQGYIYLRP